jgi:hypothetical protein
MNVPNANEIWQVEVGGQVYEAPFYELGDWIGEGSLHPNDKVRKGNLRWIEAKRVPSLVPFFNAKEQGLPMPVVVSTTDAATSTAEAITQSSPLTTGHAPEVPLALSLPEVQPASIDSDPIDHSIAVPAESHAAPIINPDFCALHVSLPTVYLCEGCGSGFCKACPKSYGGSVRICPLCGAMCRTLTEINQKRSEQTRRETAISAGFGAEDFFKALAHPFKFKASLFFGALMFMGFSLGQGVTSIGGIYMIVSGIFCVMLSNMLWFGVLANTIDHFAHGDLEANFMPSFDDFNLWDDVIHPFFLSIGAYISSFGPFLTVLLIGSYLVMSSVGSQMNEFQENVEKIPGTHYYDANRTVDQSQQVKSVLGDVSNKHNQRIEDFEDAASGDMSDFSDTEQTGETESVSARETREQEELWQMAQDSRRQSLESVLGKSPETEEKESAAMIQSFLSLAAPLVVLGGIFFLWGLFYFPAACAIAGYTRSFSATLNPVLGLDTIRRLGGTYVAILFMGLILGIASLIVSGIAAAVFAPFDLPMFGNLPARAIGALFGFYLSVVFSCILGYAMFKKADKLQLNG